MRHYRRVLALWQATPGVHVGESDSPEGIGFYLRRNRGLSLVALDGGRVVGALLVGHDGMRGFLHHLAVAADCRRKGLGRRLVAEALRRLKAAGITQCRLIVYRDNRPGRRFWKSLGWEEFDRCVYAGKSTS